MEFLWYKKLIKNIIDRLQKSAQRRGILIQIRVTEEEKQIIDEIVAKTNLSIHKAAYQLLRFGLDQYLREIEDVD